MWRARSSRQPSATVYSPFDWLGYAPFDPSQVKTPPPEPVVIAVLIMVLALIVVVAVVAAVIAIWTKRKLRADPEYATLEEKRPEGYWMGVGMALGVALGLPLGLLIGNAMGSVGTGLALARAWELRSASPSARRWSSGTRARPAR